MRTLHQPHRQAVSSKASRPVWKRLRYILLAIMVVGYLGITNSVATQGYQLADKQRAFDAAESQKSELELRVTALQALPRLEAEAAALALVPHSGIEYLVPSATAVAVR